MRPTVRTTPITTGQRCWRRWDRSPACGSWTLAIHYASDRAAGFAEFCRVLRPGGAAVVSTQHPVMDWLRKNGSYFQTTLETDIWPSSLGEQPVHFWREPLSNLCTAATDAGFLIENSSSRSPPKQCANATPRTTRN